MLAAGFPRTLLKQIFVLFIALLFIAVPLLESSHEVVGVVTQPDRPKGRGKVVMPPPVKELAQAHGLPVVYPDATYLDAPKSIKGLVSLGPKWSEVHFELADLIDRTLKGADPATQPMRQITQSDLVVVPKVAEEMGLKIPESILARASRVID